MSEGVEGNSVCLRKDNVLAFFQVEFEFAVSAVQELLQSGDLRAFLLALQNGESGVEVLSALRNALNFLIDLVETDLESSCFF